MSIIYDSKSSEGLSYNKESNHACARAKSIARLLENERPKHTFADIWRNTLVLLLVICCVGNLVYPVVTKNKLSINLLHTFVEEGMQDH